MAARVKDTKWGHPLAVWAAAREQARCALVACATSRSTISYSELCDAVEAARFRPYSWALMALIDEVCRDEDGRSGAALATLVVRRDTRRPGEGYFAWAEREGDDVCDREAYWTAQAERVWQVYGHQELTAAPEGPCDTDARSRAAGRDSRAEESSD